MKHEPTKRELVEAIVDLLFIAENDSNLKGDSMYKDYKKQVLADIEKLNVYEIYDRLLYIEQIEQTAKPVYKSHYLH